MVRCWLLAGVCALVVGCAEDGRLATGGAPRAEDRLALLETRLARNPRDVATLNAIGHEYARLGRWSRSAGAHREALILAPADRAAMMGFGGAQVGLADYAGAMEQGRRAMAGGADTPAMLLVSAAMAGGGRHAEARALIDRAMAADPADLDARNNLGLTLALAGDASAVAVTRAVAFAPTADLRHRRNHVMVAAMLGREGEARADAARLGIDGGVAEAVIALGRRARSEGARAFGVAAPL